MQQVRTESSPHGNVPEVSGQDTARSGKTENAVQGVRAEEVRTNDNGNLTVKEREKAYRRKFFGLRRTLVYKTQKGDL